MPINDYKEITIPEGSVKQIQDSNGNIIWGSQSAFPYRRLEYIESTDNTAKGKYCIQFDFYCSMSSSSNNHLDVEFQLTKNTFDRTNGQYYGGILSMNGQDARFGYVDNYNSRFIAYLTGTGTIANLTSKAWNLNKHLYSVYKNNCYVDGTNIGACVSGTVPGGKNISLFNQKYDNSEWSILGKFYKMEIYNGSTYYHRVFPCQRKSDGAIGVYNTINGKFYTNIGTGTFKAGPVIDEYWNLQA